MSITARGLVVTETALLETTVEVNMIRQRYMQKGHGHPYFSDTEQRVL